MGRLVYDSEAGRLCPDCSQPVNAYRCREQQAVPEGDGVVRIRREVRNGKPVTVILGLLLAEPDLRALAKQLKKKCGAGGSVKDGAIEVQGDRRDVVAKFLGGQGHTVKLAGG